MRKKIYLVIFLMILVTFFSGITYSFFNSSVNATTTNQKIAGFIFDANSLDKIDLNLSGFKPGDEKEYLFSVANTTNNNISDVTVEYELIIKTYHFMPLTIDLYLIENEEDKYIGSCDEKKIRNSENELICNMPIRTLLNSKRQQDNYKLKISFPLEYNSSLYSGLVDYVNIEISSWQKV